MPARHERLPSVRQRLRSWLSAQRIPERRGYDIVLAVDEAVTNSAQHAYRDSPGPGAATVTASTESTPLGSEVVVEVVVTVTDRGHWRPHEAADDGRGLPMIRAVADHLLITHDGPTTVTARFQVRHTPKAPHRDGEF